MVVPQTLSDNDLLRLMLAGDEAAFALLYQRRQGGIYRFAWQMCGSEMIAEDVTQEVFMALLRDEARGYDPARGSLAAYLYGIARHQVLRALERDKSYVPLNGDGGTDDDAPVAEALINRSDLLANLAREEMVAQLHGAIATLPAHYREALVLCDLHEMSYAEAALIINCAVGTVRSRLHRARALLIEKLHATKDAPEHETTSQKILPAGCFA
ncbi:MAG: RNA polymerase sigma factor [Pyrinomonadaceae bacterium]